MLESGVGEQSPSRGTGPLKCPLSSLLVGNVPADVIVPGDTLLGAVDSPMQGRNEGRVDRLVVCVNLTANVTNDSSLYSSYVHIPSDHQSVRETPLQQLLNTCIFFI
jgi:hypothetical protein